MTNVELLKLFGAADESYIREAQALRSGKGEKRTAPPNHRKLWLLVAAVITALALSVTAYAALTSRAWVQLEALPEITEPSQERADVMTTYYPQAIPEGYRISYGDIFSTGVRAADTRYLAFENDELGTSFSFNLSVTQSLEEFLEQDSDYVTEETVTLSGGSGVLRATASGGQRLYWENTEADYAAVLSAGADANVDLIALAESVAAGEALPESFRYTDAGELQIWEPPYPDAQAMPQGYYCAFSSSMFGEAVVYYQRPKDNSASGSDYYRIEFKVNNSYKWGFSDNDNCTLETVDIGGTTGTLANFGDYWELAWEAPSGGYNFLFICDDPEANLTAIAASVSARETPEAVTQQVNYIMEICLEPSTYTGFTAMYPHELPEGYSVSEVGEKSLYYGTWEIAYGNAAGDEMTYTMTYHLFYENTITFEEAPTEVDVNGQVGYLYPNASGTAQNLIWTDAERGYVFLLTGGNEIDLAAVARSVAEGDELQPAVNEKTVQALAQLGDYQITDLPENMFEDSVTGWPLEAEDDWYSYVRRFYYDSNNRNIYMEYSTYIAKDFAAAQEVANSTAASYGGEPQSVSINGCPGAMADSDTESCVAWVLGDEKESVLFTLYSDDFTAEELLEIALSVEKAG